MDLFAEKNPEKALSTGQIKAKIAELLELGEDSTVMVTELNCQDEDCPEVETVVAIFRAGQPKVQITLHSGVEEITDEEIERLCRKMKENPQQAEAPLVASAEMKRTL